MKRGTKYFFAGILLTFALVLFLGPKPETPLYHTFVPKTPKTTLEAEAILTARESNLSIKPKNEASIVWVCDSSKARTRQVLVYLHGFGASHEEGNPVHRHVADRVGANLLLTRLYDHGLTDTLPMQHFSVQKFWDDALEYLSIARALGDEIILMGTSTGASLALLMASHFDDVNAIILLSPNIRVNDPNIWIMNQPWGLQLGRAITGSNKTISDHPAEWYDKYWYRQYSLNAVAELQQFLKIAMKPTVFKRVFQPALMLYYYKNEQEKDDVVRVDAMLKMFDELSTPSHLKLKQAIPEAADHVIGCHLRSGDIDAVKLALEVFIDDILNANVD
ncbi:alpha/beta hydrolase [Alkalitalea saponilacus]|uniref:Esterase/lipase n=1 Tax=Alkalitalea saponilacus TaxID=889453 RepID=A0A1T5D372_9BACT|nr:alpha/beta fold hydrolase [Alkalitalea saponilacus]ASB50559.1 alpha/beta hydrolase [Alkalitalea saponilacus]SKB66154.1 Esterase/lipase [Alkalitalea saponilacus]